MQNGKLTKAEMVEILKQMGVKQNYRPYQSDEEDSGTIHLQTRKPAKIVDGYLEGHDVTVYDNQTFLVRSHRVNKVTRLAVAYNLKFQKLDGEALLYVPVALADVVFPAFNVKVRRILSPEQKKVRTQILATARETVAKKGATV